MRSLISSSLVGLVVVLCAAMLSGGCKSTQSAIVVGVNDAALFADNTMAAPGTPLVLGTVVEVLEPGVDVVKVNAGHGRVGYIRRIQLCDLEEFRERHANQAIPHRTACVGHGENGYFIHGGNVAVVDNQLSFQPGQALWCDASTKGKKGFSIGKAGLKHKADVIYFINADGSIVELDILPAP